jgi:hypothetical protein
MHSECHEPVSPNGCTSLVRSFGSPYEEPGQEQDRARRSESVDVAYHLATGLRLSMIIYYVQNNDVPVSRRVAGSMNVCCTIRS